MSTFIPKKPPTKGVIYLRNMPKHVKDHFKAYCAKRGKTMKQAIVEFMKQCVKQETKRS